MKIEIFQVDAFTDSPFRGNPAGVCLLPKPADASWMQDVAAEMNLAETAFLVKQEDGFDLRWFTPTVEVDLCGHATLASAHILWETGRLKDDEQARFHTRSGLLTALRAGPWIEMNFPAEPEELVGTPENLVRALGATPEYVGKNRFDYLVELESEEIVRKIQPDLSLLKSMTCRGVIVTSRSSSQPYDFISRFFAPGVGIDEDPVTGSAHCCLGPYWAKRLGKNTFLAYQASKRGGEVRVRIDGDRVVLGGQAVSVLKGHLV
ncbi:MAG: PhzF family phenazine biosynthesis protein [bacterium]